MSGKCSHSKTVASPSAGNNNSLLTNEELTSQVAIDASPMDAAHPNFPGTFASVCIYCLLSSHQFYVFIS